MKHRRRTQTQTIIRKKTARTTNRKHPQKERRLPGFFKAVFILLLLGGVVYLSLQVLWPAVKEKLPALNEITSGQTTPEESTRPELPTETADSQEESASPQTSPNETFLPAIQVEILNGCGEQGIAKTLSEKLMALNYDVVNTGNYLKKGKPFFEVKKTRIIDQVNSEKTREKAKKLAEQLGISQEQIESFSNPNPIADITIIVGQDFKTLKIFKGKSE